MELDGAFLYRDRGHFRRNLMPETRRALADLMGLTAAVQAALAAPSRAEDRGAVQKTP